MVYSMLLSSFLVHFTIIPNDRRRDGSVKHTHTKKTLLLPFSFQTFPAGQHNKLFTGFRLEHRVNDDKIKNYTKENILAV